MDEEYGSIQETKKDHYKKIWKLENFEHVPNQEPNDQNEDDKC